MVHMSKPKEILPAILLSCLPFFDVLSGYSSNVGNSGILLDPVVSSTVQQKMTTSDSTCLSLDSLNNALVHDEDFGWVRLRNGIFSVDKNDSLLYGAVGYFGKFTFVDLDNDGFIDALATLGTNTGGSGCFNSLVVFLNKNGTPVYTDSYSIGDREGVDSIKINNRTLRVFFKKHSPNDAMCCPSLTVEKQFEFINNKLRELK
jgi:hypothetical protein